jgi:hypothetical protein
MSEDKDELEQFLVAIESTHWKRLAQWEKEHIVRAMRLLAAALRAERERVAELELDAALGRMVRAAKDTVLDYEKPFHLCACCGGSTEFFAALNGYASRHTPDCPWAALVAELEKSLVQAPPCPPIGGLRGGGDEIDEIRDAL